MLITASWLALMALFISSKGGDQNPEFDRNGVSKASERGSSEPRAFVSRVLVQAQQREQDIRVEEEYGGRLLTGGLRQPLTVCSFSPLARTTK